MGLEELFDEWYLLATGIYEKHLRLSRLLITNPANSEYFTLLAELNKDLVRESAIIDTISDNSFDIQTMMSICEQVEGKHPTILFRISQVLSKLYYTFLNRSFVLRLPNKEPILLAEIAFNLELLTIHYILESINDDDEQINVATKKHKPRRKIKENKRIKIFHICERVFKGRNLKLYFEKEIDSADNPIFYTCYDMGLSLEFSQDATQAFIDAFCKYQLRTLIDSGSSKSNRETTGLINRFVIMAIRTLMTQDYYKKVKGQILEEQMYSSDYEYIENLLSDDIMPNTAKKPRSHERIPLPTTTIQ